MAAPAALLSCSIAAPVWAQSVMFTWLYIGLMVMAAVSCLWRAATVRAERVAWTVMGAGLLSWTFGELCWTLAFNNYDVVPVPSVADAGYLLYYPAAFVTLVLLFRERCGSSARASGSTGPSRRWRWGRWPRPSPSARSWRPPRETRWPSR